MKKSVSFLVSIFTGLISIALLIIGNHLRLGYVDFKKFTDVSAAMTADLDIRWFIGPYAYILIVAGIILAIITFYIISKTINNKRN